MNEVDELADRLVAQGYYPVLRRVYCGWSCELYAGMDVVKDPSQPRPSSMTKPTALEALQAVAALIPKAK